MPPCPQSPAREQHGDAQAVVLVTAATASPPSIPPSLPGCWRRCLSGNGWQHREVRRRWEHPPAKPGRQDPPPCCGGAQYLFFPTLILDAAKDRRRAAVLQGRFPSAPLSAVRAPRRGAAGVFPSPLHSPAPSPVPKGPLPGLHGRWTLPSAWRGGCFRGCHQPAGVPRFPERG